MSRNRFAPPAYCPQAIPTINGWVDPATGELIVSMKGLPGAVSDYKRGKPYVPMPVTVTTIDTTPEVTPEVTRTIRGSTKINKTGI